MLLYYKNIIKNFDKNIIYPIIINDKKYLLIAIQQYFFIKIKVPYIYVINFGWLKVKSYNINHKFYIGGIILKN